MELAFLLVIPIVNSPSKAPAVTPPTMTATWKMDPSCSTMIVKIDIMIPNTKTMIFMMLLAVFSDING